MSRETLVNKSEQSSDVFYTGKYAKYNINTSQQSTDTVWNFNCNLSKVSDLPLSALEKSVTATVSCFNSNPEFLSSGSDKSVIATSASGKSTTDSNLSTADESRSVGAVSTCNSYDVAAYRWNVALMSNIEKKDLLKNIFVQMTNCLFQKTIEVLSLNGSNGSLGYVILQVKMQFIVWLVLCLVTSFLKKHQVSKDLYSQPFRHWPEAFSVCNVHAEWKKKKKESSNEPYQSLHRKTWPILCNIMAHLKSSDEEIEVMLTKSPDKEVQKIAANENELLTR